MTGPSRSAGAHPRPPLLGMGRHREPVALPFDADGAIEVGAHNTYGHPVAATLQTLRAAGAAIYRTDRDGSVRVEGQGDRLTVATHA